MDNVSNSATPEKSFNNDKQWKLEKNNKDLSLS